MFDKQYYSTTNVINNHSKVANQMRLDRKSREKLAKKEIKARDRVDISLEEYEEIKNKIKDLQGELAQMKYILSNFGGVENLNIIPNTTEIRFSDCYDFLSRKRKCEVTFDFISDERF